MAIETVVRIRSASQQRIYISKPIRDALALEEGDLLKVSLEKISKEPKEKEPSFSN